MKKLLTVLLLLLSFNACAQNTLIQWIAPTENTLNEPLGDRLAGFNIYYGPSIGVYDTNINIPNPTVTYHVLNLSPETYHAVITAYDIDGRESAWSVDLDLTVPQPLPKHVTGASWVVSE